MHVLIAKPDVYARISGVDRFYRHVIARHPTVRFTVSQSPGQKVVDAIPANAELLPYADGPGPSRAPRSSSWAHEMLGHEAVRIAASVAGGSFDVVDVPSTLPLAHMLPAALADHNVSVHRFVLGLHGFSSDSTAAEFGPSQASLAADLALHEDLALAAADARYAFSPLCIADATARGLGVTSLDPLDVLPALQPLHWTGRAGPVDIVQIGALAGYKGGDLLIRIVAGAPRDVIGRLVFVGPDVAAGPDAAPGRPRLQALADELGVEVAFAGTPDDAWLDENVYARRVIVALASRQESFGFAAAEALLRGVPIILSRHVGLADTLRDSWTDLPATIIEPQDPMGSRAALLELASSYDDNRATLVAALLARPERERRAGFLLPAYESTPSFSADARDEGRAWLRRLVFPAARVAAPEKPWRNTKEPVQIVMAVDDAMAAAASVTIASIAAHAGAGRDYRLALLHVGLTEASRELLEAAGGGRVHVELRQLADLQGFERQTGPAPAICYARLLIPQQGDIGPKALYLDGDLIVRSDVAELFDTDLDGFSLGAVPDEGIVFLPEAGWPDEADPKQNAGGRHFRTHLEMRAEDIPVYFNSGVMLIDVSQWRQTGVLEQAKILFERKKRWFGIADQDLLNALFQGRYHRLEARWNVLARFGHSPTHDRGGTVLHYAGPGKPWRDRSSPGATWFWAAARGTKAEAVLEAEITKRPSPSARAKPSHADRDWTECWIDADTARVWLSPRGWSRSEAEGTWITSERSTLFLPVSRLPATITLAISGLTVASTPDATVTLSIGGESVSVALPTGEVRPELTCPVPPSARLIGGRCLALTLDLPGFAVPIEEGWSTDIRMLRLFLRQLRITPDYPPPVSLPASAAAASHDDQESSLFTALERLTLQALASPGERGRAAFATWWEQVDLDTAGYGIRRLAPLLYRRALQFERKGPLLGRLRGLARHTWLANELRLRKLPEVLRVLEPSGGALLLKGAATLARFGHLSELRPIGDVDLLAPRGSIEHAFQALRAAGLQPLTIVPERLDEDDLARFHAVAFAGEPHEVFDLHWRPLRDIVDTRLAEEMLQGSHAVAFGGTTVRVPPVADHLFQVLMHGLEATKDGRIDFVLEAGLLACTPNLDIEWCRFHALQTRYMQSGRIGEVFAFLRDDVGLELPPALTGRATLGERLERRLRGSPAGQSECGTRLGAAIGLCRSSGRQEMLPLLARGSSAGSEADALAWRTVDGLEPGEQAAAAAARWADTVAPQSAAAHKRPRFLAGFSYPEIAGRWTDGRQAALQVPGLPSGRVVFTLEATPFFEGDHDRVEIALATRVDGSTTVLMPDRFARRRLLVVGEPNTAGNVAVGLSIKEPHAPETRCDRPADSRLLGLHLHEIGSSELVEVSPPAVLSVGDERLILGQGWSISERGGCWTDQAFARLLLRVRVPPRGLDLTLHVGLVNAPSAPLAVRFGLCGSSLTNGALLDHGRPTELKMRVTPEAACSGDLIAIELALDSPSPPRAGSDETRELGIFLERVSVQHLSTAAGTMDNEGNELMSESAPVVPIGAVTATAEILRHEDAIAARVLALEARVTALESERVRKLHFRGHVRSARTKTQKLVRAVVGPKMFFYEQYRPRTLRLRPPRAIREPAGGWPSIGIVTPSYQQARFVGRTIDSVLSQNYPRLSYAVQDGGSTDGTIEVLQRYGSDLDWRSAPDRGQCHAINLGFERVPGEIMGWLNSDDVLAPGTLAEVATVFAARPEIDFIYGNRIYIDAEDLEVGRCILPPHDPETLRWMDFVPQETMFWRRRVWERTGPLDETFRFALDWDFLLRAQAAGARMLHVPLFLGCFRVHDQQKNAAIMDVGTAEMALLRARELGRLPDHLQIRSAIFPYTLRHIVLDKLYRLGLYRI